MSRPLIPPAELMALTYAMIAVGSSSLPGSRPVAEPTGPRSAYGNTTLIFVAVTPRSLAVKGEPSGAKPLPGCEPSPVPGAPPTVAPPDPAALLEASEASDDAVPFD